MRANCAYGSCNTEFNPERQALRVCSDCWRLAHSDDTHHSKNAAQDALSSSGWADGARKFDRYFGAKMIPSSKSETTWTRS
jgi:hypothetical protein